MQYPYGPEVFATTASEFKEAVNASFIPVSNIGGPQLLIAYNKYSDQLPMDTGSGQEVTLKLDIATITALNALHALTLARERVLGQLDPTIPPAKHELALTARVIAVDEVVKAQQQIANSTDGQYQDTSLTGQ